MGDDFPAMLSWYIEEFLQTCNYSKYVKLISVENLSSGDEISCKLKFVYYPTKDCFNNSQLPFRGTLSLKGHFPDGIPFPQSANSLDLDSYFTWYGDFLVDENYFLKYEVSFDFVNYDLKAVINEVVGTFYDIKTRDW